MTDGTTTTEVIPTEETNVTPESTPEVESNTKYIGTKEIDKIEWCEVTFKDGTTQTFNEKQLEYMITTEMKDASAFEAIMSKAIVVDVWKVIQEEDPEDIVTVAGKILKVYEDHDIMNRQVDKIGFEVITRIKIMIETVARSYIEWFNVAVAKAFGTYIDWKPTQTFVENIRVSDIVRLKQ